MKTCKTCKQDKDLTEFNKHPATADRHLNHCKQCVKARKAKYYLNEKEKIQVKNKENYELHKSDRLAQMKAYYSANKDTIIEQHKGYVKENGKKVKDYQKEYRKTHKNNKAANIRWRKRRALKQSVNESYTKDDEQYTLDLFNRSCAYCGTSEKLCIDHHKPLSKGHALSRTNAVVLCNSCNCQKNNKMPEEFYPLDILKEIDSKLSPNPRKG
jgi:5-methylcytosine-specific restriction endonuclease McrA